MTRARARQLNILVNSLLFESRLDISESWILPHAPYLCLISFAGEDGKRNDDRETKDCLLFSDQTGLTAGQTGQTDASAAEPLDRSDWPWRRSDRHSVGLSREGRCWSLVGFRPSFTGGQTALHTGQTGASGSTGPSTPVGPPDAWAEPNFPKPAHTIKEALPPSSKGENR